MWLTHMTLQDNPRGKASNRSKISWKSNLQTTNQPQNAASGAKKVLDSRDKCPAKNPNADFAPKMDILRKPALPRNIPQRSPSNKVPDHLMQDAKENEQRKCSINQSQISFCGLIWTRDGVKPEREKCDRIYSRPGPSNTGVTIIPWLGAQHVSLYSKSLVQGGDLLISPSREQYFQVDSWSVEKFEDLKALRYFNPASHAQLKLMPHLVNLVQHPYKTDQLLLIHSSEALTHAKHRFANTEREFVYGKEFVVESDHKPLEQVEIYHPD